MLPTTTGKPSWMGRSNLLRLATEIVLAVASPLLRFISQSPAWSLKVGLLSSAQREYLRPKYP
jgi:hypothetical protein